MDGLRDERCCVIRRGVGQAFGEFGLQLYQRFLNGGTRVQGIGAGLQKDTDWHGGVAIDAAIEVVILGAQFHPGHVLQSDHGTLVATAHHDVGKLFRCQQSALGGDSQREFFGVVGRRANLAGGVLGILLTHRGTDITHGNAQLGHAVRAQPQPHGVVLGTKDLHVGGSGHTLDGIEHVLRDVVGDEQRVKAVVGRVDRRHSHEARRALGHGHALALHFLRKFVQHLVDAVVDIHRGDVQIRANFKGHVDGHRAVARRCGVHVQHLLDAVDCLLDGRGHCGFQHLGGSTGVHRRNADHRWRYFRVA